MARIAQQLPRELRDNGRPMTRSPSQKNEERITSAIKSVAPNQQIGGPRGRARIGSLHGIAGACNKAGRSTHSKAASTATTCGHAID